MNKKKKIKKLQKVHIIPNIIMFFVIVLVFSIALTGMLTVFLTYVVEDKLEEMMAEATPIVREIESQNDKESDALQYSSEDTKRVFVVVDKKGNALIDQAGFNPEKEDLFSVKYGDEDVFLLDHDNMNLVSGKDGEEFDVRGMLSHFIKDSLIGSDFSKEWGNKAAFSFDGWIKVPVFDGKYNMYYKSKVVVYNKEMGYLSLICIFSCLAFGVPLILYMVTMIVNCVVQRKNANLIFMDATIGEKNWLFFEQKIGKRLSKRKNLTNTQSVIASLNFDKYSAYCACYGPSQGEMLLERISRVLKNNLQKKESFARYVDAEFALYLFYDSKEQCETRMNAIMEQLKACAEGRKIEFSSGICEVTPESHDVDVLYNNAVAARRALTYDSQNTIGWFDKKLREEQLWEVKVEETMEAALANGEFQVYIQPKYTPDSGTLGGAEALIRWISPTEGFIGPGRFIPIFEKNGFITRIDDFMLESVCKLQAQWIAEGKQVVPVSVNISRVHFSQPDLAEHIQSIVESTGVSKELIELELTESAFFEDKNILINTVAKLKQMGFTVSMDDFGAGYSSLNSLKDLPLDVLKLDAEFFRGSGLNDERGSWIVKETIQLAKQLGMRIVAEGIEEKDQVEFLADTGCDLIQGFYFAKPMPAEEYETKMKDA